MTTNNLAKIILIDLLDDEPAIGIISQFDNESIDILVSDSTKKYLNLKEKFTDDEFDSMMIAIMSKLQLIATIENMEIDYAKN